MAAILPAPDAPDACALVVHDSADDQPWLALFAGMLGDRGYAVRTLAAAAATPASIAETAAALRRRFARPLLAIGHGAGGPRLLAGLAGIAAPAGLVFINSPCGCDEFSAAAHRTRLPLLIMHAPLDTEVPIEEAAKLFAAAKHPKSFVSLDGADHHLANPIEARHAADSLIGWAMRYVRRPASEREIHDIVVEENGAGRLAQRIRAGRHRLTADEPAGAGGEDDGPAPYDLLLAALGACTAMTIRMYAKLKGLPLRHVRVALHHEKIHAADCAECETREGRIDRIDRVITLQGDLSAEQRQRLLDIANKCPVHRTLHAEVHVPTHLADDPE